MVRDTAGGGEGLVLTPASRMLRLSHMHSLERGARRLGSSCMAPGLEEGPSLPWLMAALSLCPEPQWSRQQQWPAVQREVMMVAPLGAP